MTLPILKTLRIRRTLVWKKKKKREGKSFILADLDRIKGFRMFGSNLHGAGTCFKQKKRLSELIQHYMKYLKYYVTMFRAVIF